MFSMLKGLNKRGQRERRPPVKVPQLHRPNYTAHPGEDVVLGRVRPHGVKVLVFLLPDGHDHVGEGGFQILHFHCEGETKYSQCCAYNT